MFGKKKKTQSKASAERQKPLLDENIDITQKDILAKLDEVEHDYDDFLAEYEQTLEQRAQAVMKRVSAQVPGEDEPEGKADADESASQQEGEEPESGEDNLARSVYSAVETLGFAAGDAAKRAWRKPKRFFFRALLFIKAMFRFAWLAVLKVMHVLGHGFAEQLKAFGTDLRSASKYIKKSRNSPATTVSVMFFYVKKGFARHKQLLKTFANIAMPAAAVIVFLITVNYWSSVTFALKVNYNNMDIGYISDESVYNAAQAQVKSRIEGDAQEIESPTYELALVSVNQLVDASTLSDRIIENSENKLVNACGIYINDEFLCAVKNETDATSVFNAILEPYANQIDDEDSFVDFVEKVEYVQGLYPDDTDTVWDAARLTEKLSTTKESAVYYTVQDGDTIYGIAVDNGMTERQLLALNPEIEDYIHTGDRLVISNEVNYVRVKVMRTEQREVEIDYDTEEVNDSSMFRGTRRTIREGEPGEEIVTELVTYVDNERVSAEEISRERTKEPVSARVRVGTKSTTVYSAGGSYNITTSGSGFVWPTPACTTISSPYGYRTALGYAEYHTGVDLIRPGGGSSGAIIVASMDGVVEVVQRTNSGYGNMVLINHGGGIKTRYAHCLGGSISVSVGQSVTAGQAIARVGETGYATGPHLHFEIIINGSTVNPMSYLR